MTHKLNLAVDTQRVGVNTVHAVQCDCQDCGSLSHQDKMPDGSVVRHACSHATYNPATPDHEWYVPLGWGIYPDGTHKCPDCRTKAAVKADHQEQEQMVRDFEQKHGDNCVTCTKPEQEHYVDGDDCGHFEHGRTLARPLYKIRQAAHGLRDWSAEPEDHHHVDHIVAFGALLNEAH